MNAVLAAAIAVARAVCASVNAVARAVRAATIEDCLVSAEVVRHALRVLAETTVGTAAAVEVLVVDVCADASIGAKLTRARVPTAIF